MGSGPGGEGVAEGLGMVQGKLELQDREDMGVHLESQGVSTHHALSHVSCLMAPGSPGPDWSPMVRAS